MHRYELSDEQWDLIQPQLQTVSTGRPRCDDRTTPGGVLWKLCSGAAWRDVPERYGKWRTVYDRFAGYRDDGTLDRILEVLHLKLDAEGRIDWTTWMIDATSIRASRVAAGAQKKDASAKAQADQALGRSRGGLTTKLHLVCDGGGLPLAVHVRAGQRAESAQFEATCGVVRAVRWPKRLIADRGYDAKRIRAWVRVRRIRAVIPERKLPTGKKRRRRGRPPVLQADQYRRRNAIERLVGWLKEHRSLATRYDKLASSFLAMVKLACIRRLLRAAFPNKP